MTTTPLNPANVTSLLLFSYLCVSIYFSMYGASTPPLVLFDRSSCQQPLGCLVVDCSSWCLRAVHGSHLSKCQNRGSYCAHKGFSLRLPNTQQLTILPSNESAVITLAYCTATPSCPVVVAGLLCRMVLLFA